MDFSYSNFNTNMKALVCTQWSLLPPNKVAFQRYLKQCSLLKKGSFIKPNNLNLEIKLIPATADQMQNYE